MRFIRLLFIAVIAIFLIMVALANREIVTISAFPARFGEYLNGNWAVSLPLFLIIFLAMIFGMVVGLLWEWLREAHLRRESKSRAAEVARLEREVGQVRRTAAAPKDDVLAILDAPRTRESAAQSGQRPIASAEPARGTTLPSPR